GVVTVSAPFFAPAGTLVVTVVAVGVRFVVTTPPPKVTDVVPPSPVPLIVTVEPTLPLVGLIELIVGPAGVVVVMVKLDELVAVVPFVTAIGPVVAPDGTIAMI